MKVRFHSGSMITFAFLANLGVAVITGATNAARNMVTFEEDKPKRVTTKKKKSK